MWQLGILADCSGGRAGRAARHLRSTKLPPEEGQAEAGKTTLFSHLNRHRTDTSCRALSQCILAPSSSALRANDAHGITTPAGCGLQYSARGCGVEWCDNSDVSGDLLTGRSRCRQASCLHHGTCSFETMPVMIVIWQLWRVIIRDVLMVRVISTKAIWIVELRSCYVVQACSGSAVALSR